MKDSERATYSYKNVLECVIETRKINSTVIKKK